MKLFGRHLSLRMRLTAWSVSVVALALTIFAVSGYFGLRTFLKDQLQAAFRNTAHVVAQSFLQHVPERGEAWAVDQMHTIYPGANTHRLVRVSSDGRLIYQNGSLDDALSVFPSTPMPSHAPEAGAFHRFRADGHVYLIFLQEYTAPHGATYEIEVVGSLEGMLSALQSLQTTYAVSMPLILILAGAGGYLLLRRPLQPLVTLTSKADNIGRHAMGERLPVIETGDEVQSLAESLNRMIDRLEESLAHNRRFSADASHELRTPLAILRGEMEEMLRCPGLPEQAAGNTVSAIEELERMSRIVQGLMDITRLDAGGERMHLQRVNLSELTRSTVEQMRLLADASDIPLELMAPRDLLVLADPFRIKQVLVNLIDNAIKYTADADEREDSRAILVSLMRGEADVTLEVRDHGVGIADHALERVFDRFYRAEESRNRRQGGSGLGLAIVRAIVIAHGGSVSAHRVAGGTAMRVVLPADLPALDGEAAAPSVTAEAAFSR